ncbi:KEOPS complex subunit Pcc1 [Methanobacterium alcaliphilum]|uniref:KEOPS complex subunit Pcc1 n=1 Tax=Methanobacterium alcaliphilum TaxID=392018 RepID=UPI00200B0CD4|nr:KEOPS complex subunit Pcc1 [Methanobacterium alcaliphilum]MCK9152057.1 hypothetical protein [Methanobacterium alcaliphilum]
MNATAPLKYVESEILIEFDNPTQAELIFTSVQPEISSSPSQRSSMTMDLQGNNIHINIKATDATSFRASLNSSLKWIILSLDVLNLKNKK